MGYLPGAEMNLKKYYFCGEAHISLNISMDCSKQNCMYQLGLAEFHMSFIEELPTLCKPV